MVAVSVVVTTRGSTDALAGLLRSIDDQTLPAAEFELVVVGSDDVVAGLQQLAGRRPNVTVLDPGSDVGDLDRLRQAVETSKGRHLVLAEAEDRLAPRALELLIQRAEDTGAELVLGRSVTRTSSGSTAIVDDADRLEDAATGLAGCVALVARTVLTEHPGDATDPAALTRAASGVATLGRYAASIREPVDLDSQPVVESAGTSWAEGTLLLAARLSPSAAPEHAWLVLASDHAEIAIPAAIEPDAAGVAVSGTLDPRALDDGGWRLLLRLARPDREWTVALGGGPAGAAVVEGRPYLVRALGGALHLDVGAPAAGMTGRVMAADASVRESVQGILVTIRQPALHVHGDAVLDARLLLDRFSMPARLIAECGAARVEAYIGALAGVSRVALLVGGGTPVQTGLQLRVDGVGRMTFEPVPPKTPKPPVAPSPPAPIQRIRRAVPAPLEPAVKRLSTVPVLRRTYRRLLKR